MIGKWFQDALQQWRQNPRLRYAVLLVLAILAMHGVLKIADRRDEVAKSWARDQELMARFREVAAEPEWTKRSSELMQQWRDSVARLPHAMTMGEAKAEQQVWLSDFASRNKFATAKVTVQDALDVPAHPGMIQVVSRLDVDGVAPWLYGEPLREVAAALPWRQVQRAEIVGVSPGKLSLTFRNYYRTDKFVMPPGFVEPKPRADKVSAKPVAASNAPVMPVAAPASPAAAASTNSSQSSRVPMPANAKKEGVLKQVLKTPEDGVSYPGAGGSKPR